MSPVGCRQDGLGAVTLKTMPSGWIERLPTRFMLWSRLGVALEDEFVFSLLTCAVGCAKRSSGFCNANIQPRSRSCARTSVGKREAARIVVGRQDYA